MTFVTLLVTLLVLAWTVTDTDSSRRVLSAPREPGSIPFTDVHPYGANFFLEREVDPWTQENTVEAASEGGLRFAKQHFRWYEIEREPGVFEWSKYDRIVDLYREAGLEVIARLDYPAAWVKEDPSEYAPELNNPPDDVDDYARFVAETVGRYRGRVRFYQIWNEPNLHMEWGRRPVSPVEYVELLRAAADAARAADPNVVILSAPLAINTETIDISGNLNDLDFLRGMYEAGAADYFDILSANAFGMDLPPGSPPSREVLNFRRVELQRQIMEEQGDGEKAVWFAEYGWNAAPESLAEHRLTWQRVTEEEQAAWTVEGVEYALRNWPWSGVFSIWYFRQWGGKSPDEADYYFAMVDPDFTLRRVYDSVRQGAESLMVATPGEWDERSSPVLIPQLSDWAWIRADGALGGNALESVAEKAELRFRFRGSGVAARVQGGAGASALVVELDGHRALPEPQNTLELPATGDRWTWISFGEGLGDGDHQLRLLATGDGSVAVDAFRVSAGPVRDLGAFLPHALAVLAIGQAVLVVADARRVANRVKL